MDLRRFLLVAVAMVSYYQCDAAPTILWQIGSKDGSGKEFALDRDLGRFAKEVPVDFVYTVGTDKPEKWPFIHPGPIDRWAGETTHPLKIRFDIAEMPKGECALVVGTVAAWVNGSKLSARINGNLATADLPPGPGDAVIKDESKGSPATTRMAFHPELFQPGINEIELMISDGAWTMYDFIALESDAAVKPVRLASVEATDTPFFVGKEDALRQVVRVKLENRRTAQPYQFTFSKHSHGANHDPITGAHVAPFGKSTFEIAIPQVDSPTSFSLVVAGPETYTSVPVNVSPRRKWRLFVQPSIHTDIGYTDRQSDVFHRHNLNLDKVKEMCRANPLFKWNMEVAWEVQNYFADRPEEARQELVKLMQDGRIGLNAGYLNILTALMSDEGINRFGYYSANLRRQYGIETSVSLLTDVPTATRGLVSTLTGSGIKYFAQGSNQDRGPIHRSGFRAPFYWEGADGSRVLAFLSNMYARSAWLAHSNGVADMADTVTGIVREYENLGDQYPMDAIYQYGAFLDNWEVDVRYGQHLKEWEQKYAYPKIIVTSGPEFFTYLEQNFGDKLEVRKKDFGAFWEDGAGSTQQETTLHMQNQHQAATLETLWSVAKLRGAAAAYPLAQFTKVWEDIIFYAEHTWGAAQSISAPDDPMTRDQWAFKAQYAHRPHAELRGLKQKGLEAFMNTVPAGKDDVVVFNPCSWSRSGPVEIKRDSTDGSGPAQTLWVADVPPFGAKVVPAASVSQQSQKVENGSSGVLENRYYIIQTTPGRGITSIIDKETRHQLVNQGDRHGFAQIVYAAGGDGTRMVHSEHLPFATIKHNDSGAPGLEAPPETVLITNSTVTTMSQNQLPGLWKELTITSTAPSMDEVNTRVRLFENEKRISFDVEITSKTEVRQKEAVYVAFPFNASRPQFRLGMTNVVQRPDKDSEKGGCHEWYCVQDFVSMADPASGTEVVWSSRDVPLVCLSQINQGRWITEPELTTPTIFSYAMNNYWHTNYKAGQGGHFHFRYDLTSGHAGFTNAQCLKFARDAARPLLAAKSPGKAAAVEGKPDVVVEGEDILATLAGAQDGKSTIVRLRNTAESPAEAKVTTGPRKASLVSLVEDPIADEEQILQQSEGAVKVAIKPQQTVTLRLE